MPWTSLFAGFRLTGRPAARAERVLAVGRAFLTVTALVAIYLDPTEPARLRELTYGVLLAYAAYSLAVLAYVQWAARLTSRHGRTLHTLDILWSSALTFVSEGPVSPFFLFFLFAVLAAAYRWGFRETVATAVTTVAIFLLETTIAAAGPWSATFPRIEVEANRIILRVTYLLLIGVLLGYLAEQDKQSRAELAAIALAGRQPFVTLGLNGAIAAVARSLAAPFGAQSVIVIVRDNETDRATLWRWQSTDDAEQGDLKRTEISPEEAAVWLFAHTGRAWYASRESDGRLAVRATRPDSWRLVRDPFVVPATLFGLGNFATTTAVNMDLAGEWRACIYMPDLPDHGTLEQRLHFLEELAEHVTPGLTNVFLQGRLQDRAGAAERARVARELHDGAIQTLFGMEMKVEALRRRPHPDAATLQAELAVVQNLLRAEVLSLRELMQALRPPVIDSGDQLPGVLAGIVDRFGRETGITARFVATGPRVSLSPARAIELLRIVQEALVNVRKHSQARNVLVRLAVDGASCRLIVEDDGRGFDFEGRLSADELEQRRVGPAIIKERARLAGAELFVDSAAGTGARLELRVGLDAHA